MGLLRPNTWAFLGLMHSKLAFLGLGHDCLKNIYHGLCGFMYRNKLACWTLYTWLGSQEFEGACGSIPLDVLYRRAGFPFCVCVLFLLLLLLIISVSQHNLCDISVKIVWNRCRPNHRPVWKKLKQNIKLKPFQDQS